MAFLPGRDLTVVTNETSVLTNEILLLSNVIPVLTNEIRYYPTKQEVGSNFQEETGKCVFRLIFCSLNSLVSSEGRLYNLFCTNKL